MDEPEWAELRWKPGQPDVDEAAVREWAESCAEEFSRDPGSLYIGFWLKRRRWFRWPGRGRAPSSWRILGDMTPQEHDDEPVMLGWGATGRIAAWMIAGGGVAQWIAFRFSPGLWTIAAAMGGSLLAGAWGWRHEWRAAHRRLG